MFTPEEIEARSFVLVRRGYDTDEVGAFLRAVGEDVRRLHEEVAESKRRVDPIDSAMADAVAIVHSARESAARIEAQAEERSAERLRDLEDEVARRVERARSEARAVLDEARDQAAAIIAEANARRTLAEADIAAARNSWLRESAELDVLSRRRRSVLEEAQDSLEQWMSALRDIVVEAQASSATVEAGDATAYPLEPVAELEVPTQEQYDEHVEEHVEAQQLAHDGRSYDGA